MQIVLNKLFQIQYTTCRQMMSNRSRSQDSSSVSSSSDADEYVPRKEQCFSHHEHSDQDSESDEHYSSKSDSSADNDDSNSDTEARNNHQEPSGTVEDFDSSEAESVADQPGFDIIPGENDQPLVVLLNQLNCLTTAFSNGKNFTSRVNSCRQLLSRQLLAGLHLSQHRMQILKLCCQLWNSTATASESRFRIGRPFFEVKSLMLELFLSVEPSFCERIQDMEFFCVCAVELCSTLLIHSRAVESQRVLSFLKAYYNDAKVYFNSGNAQLKRFSNSIFLAMIKVQLQILFLEGHNKDRKVLEYENTLLNLISNRNLNEQVIQLVQMLYSFGFQRFQDGKSLAAGCWLSVAFSLANCPGVKINRLEKAQLLRLYAENLLQENTKESLPQSVFVAQMANQLHDSAISRFLCFRVAIVSYITGVGQFTSALEQLTRLTTSTEFCWLFAKSAIEFMAYFINQRIASNNDLLRLPELLGLGVTMATERLKLTRGKLAFVGLMHLQVLLLNDASRTEAEALGAQLLASGNLKDSEARYIRERLPHLSEASTTRADSGSAVVAEKTVAATSASASSSAEAVDPAAASTAASAAPPDKPAEHSPQSQSPPILAPSSMPQSSGNASETYAAQLNTLSNKFHAIVSAMNRLRSEAPYYWQSLAADGNAPPILSDSVGTAVALNESLDEAMQACDQSLPDPPVSPYSRSDTPIFTRSPVARLDYHSSNDFFYESLSTKMQEESTSECANPTGYESLDKLISSSEADCNSTVRASNIKDSYCNAEHGTFSYESLNTFISQSVADSSTSKRSSRKRRMSLTSYSNESNKLFEAVRLKLDNDGKQISTADENTSSLLLCPTAAESLDSRKVLSPITTAASTAPESIRTVKSKFFSLPKSNASAIPTAAPSTAVTYASSSIGLSVPVSKTSGCSQSAINSSRSPSACTAMSLAEPPSPVFNRSRACRNMGAIDLSLPAVAVKSADDAVRLSIASNPEFSTYNSANSTADQNLGINQTFSTANTEVSELAPGFKNVKPSAQCFSEISLSTQSHPIVDSTAPETGAKLISLVTSSSVQASSSEVLLLTTGDSISVEKTEAPAEVSVLSSDHQNSLSLAEETTVITKPIDSLAKLSAQVVSSKPAELGDESITQKAQVVLTELAADHSICEASDVPATNAEAVSNPSLQAKATTSPTLAIETETSAANVDETESAELSPAEIPPGDIELHFFNECLGSVDSASPVPPSPIAELDESEANKASKGVENDSKNSAPSACSAKPENFECDDKTEKIEPQAPKFSQMLTLSSLSLSQASSALKTVNSAANVPKKSPQHQKSIFHILDMSSINSINDSFVIDASEIFGHEKSGDADEACSNQPAESALPPSLKEHPIQSPFLPILRSNNTRDQPPPPLEPSPTISRVGRASLPMSSPAFVSHSTPLPGLHTDAAAGRIALFSNMSRSDAASSCCSSLAARPSSSRGAFVFKSFGRRRLAPVDLDASQSSSDSRQGPTGPGLSYSPIEIE